MKLKAGFGGKRKVEVIKDFRQNEMYEEDITALKKKAETYIAQHAELSEPVKNNLRELKIARGATQEEVRLLLGDPDKITQPSNKESGASEIWVYKTAKSSVFTIVVFPVFFGHETYYLYFNGPSLARIELHYLEQTFQTNDSGMGLTKH